MFLLWLIGIDGVHHYDENGLNNHSHEPERIKEVHAFEVEFIKKWVKDFEKAKLARRDQQ